MLLRTHLAIAVFAILLFLSQVSNKIVFISVALIATLLPDIDNSSSFLGKYKILRIFQLFARHRGMIHSFSFCIIISVIFAAFIPILAFPFFLGYSLHLLADSFTSDGIKPFWPIRKESKGIIRTNGITENGIFIFFVFLDLILLIIALKSYF